MPDFVGLFKNIFNPEDVVPPTPYNVSLSSGSRFLVGLAAVQGQATVKWECLTHPYLSHFEIAVVEDGKKLDEVPSQIANAVGIKKSKWGIPKYSEIRYGGDLAGVVLPALKPNTTYRCVLRSISTYNKKSEWVWSNAIATGSPNTPVVSNIDVDVHYRGMKISWDSVNVHHVDVILVHSPTNYTFLNIKDNSIFVKVPEGESITEVQILPYNFELQAGTATTDSTGWTISTLAVADSDYNDKKVRVEAATDASGDIVSAIAGASDAGDLATKDEVDVSISIRGDIVEADIPDGMAEGKISGLANKVQDLSSSGNFVGVIRSWESEILLSNAENDVKLRDAGGNSIIDLDNRRVEADTNLGTGGLKIRDTGITDASNNDVIDINGLVDGKNIGSALKASSEGITDGSDVKLIDGTTRKLGSGTDAPYIGTEGLSGGLISTGLIARLNGIYSPAWMDSNDRIPLTNVDQASSFTHVYLTAMPFDGYTDETIFRVQYSTVDTTNKELEGLSNWYIWNTSTQVWDAITVSNYTSTYPQGMYVSFDDITPTIAKAFLDTNRDALIIMNNHGAVVTSLMHDELTFHTDGGTVSGGIVEADIIRTDSSGQRIIIAKSDNTLRLHTSSVSDAVLIDDNVGYSSNLPGIQVKDGCIFIYSGDFSANYIEFKNGKFWLMGFNEIDLSKTHSMYNGNNDSTCIKATINISANSYGRTRKAVSGSVSVPAGQSENSIIIGIFGEAPGGSGHTGARWAAYFGDGDVKVENDIEIDGDIKPGATDVVINTSNALRPATTEVCDLGTASYKWDNIYTKALVADTASVDNIDRILYNECHVSTAVSTNPKDPVAQEYSCNNTTVYTMIHGVFVKKNGDQYIKVSAEFKSASPGTGTLPGYDIRVTTIGGIPSSPTITTFSDLSWTAYTDSLDISSLTNGTLYEFEVLLRGGDDSGTYLGYMRVPIVYITSK